jgi:copper chaperone
MDAKSRLNLNAGSPILCPMTTTVSVSGMTCVHCVRAVFTSLAGVPGIERADVTIGQAVIEHDGTVTPEQIRDAIAVAGYTVGETKDNRRTLPLAP